MNLIPMLSLWQQLENWDKWLFLKINREWTAGWADALTPLFREKYFWAPLYIFLLVWVTLRFARKGWWWALAFIATVASTDMVSSRLFKTGIARLRPCKDPEMIPYVRLLLENCSGGFSFTSSHAANHFGMATFFYLTTRHLFGPASALAYLWAFLVAYSQIYVGVHYPLDVLGGAGIGVLLGAAIAIVFNKQVGFVIFDE